MCFPYSDNDKFTYLNLEIADKEYWKNIWLYIKFML
jgi:hypothetical protein